MKNNIEPSVLTSLVFDASSEPMTTPTDVVKKKTRNRYSVSHFSVFEIQIILL